LRFGSDEQKEKYLIPIIKGQAISCGAFTEPDHGSDITFMNTAAIKEGDEYVINGLKTFITFLNPILLGKKTEDFITPLNSLTKVE
jgi:alkylation response protein AidB-like acyl-CoA dehydrogenase